MIWLTRFYPIVILNRLTTATGSIFFQMLGVSLNLRRIKLMKTWLIRSAALVVAILMLVGGPFMNTATAGGKVALILDVGGRGDLSFNDMGF